MRLYFWQRTSTKISLLAIVVIFCLVLYLIISQGTPPTIFELIWLFLPPLFVAFMFYFQPSRIARQAAQNEKLTAETTWIVGPEGIQISSRFGSTMMEWQTFGKLVTTKSYHLLLSRTNKNAFRFLPRRVFTSPEQEADFLLIARDRVPR